MSLSEELLSGICQPFPFPHTQFPFPVTQTFFNRDFHWDTLGDQIEEIDEARLVDHLPLILALAEGVEASQPDRAEYFIPDRELRRRLVQLNDAPGWALVWGDGGEEMAQLLKRLQEKKFQNYVASPQPPGGPWRPTYLGSRPTSVIYFLQALIRYVYIYGRVPLGDSDGVAHFLEEHGPGVVFWLKKHPTPLEEALLLGLMFLGIPAVVPSTFSSPYGHTRRADSPEDMVSQALQFPNLQVRARVHPSAPLA